MASYREIEIWVKNKYGFIPADCYVAHVKEMCGLHMKKAWNRQYETRRIKPCPDDQVEPIKEAFRHFGMI